MRSSRPRSRRRSTCWIKRFISTGGSTSFCSQRSTRSPTRKPSNSCTTIKSRNSIKRTISLLRKLENRGSHRKVAYFCTPSRAIRPIWSWKRRTWKPLQAWRRARRYSFLSSCTAIRLLRSTWNPSVTTFGISTAIFCACSRQSTRAKLSNRSRSPPTD
jgi:hypothetical protein